MPKGDAEQSGWVKFHRRALRPDGSLMKLSVSARGAFLCYVALARWEESYRGCLCDPDGRPWSREERAEAIGVAYNTSGRAEAAMIEEGLIIIDKRGRTHQKHSQGRLRIINYDIYQVGHGDENVPSETEEQIPAKPTAKPCPNVPPILKEPENVPSETESDVPSKTEEPSSGVEGIVPSEVEEIKPTHNNNDVKKDLRRKGLNDLAADAAASEKDGGGIEEPTLFEASPPEKPEKPNVKKPPKEREPTKLTGTHALALVKQYAKEDDAKIVIRECWEAFGFEGPPKVAKYNELVKLVQENGHPHVQEWAEKIRSDEQQMPDGSTPSAWFPKEFRRRMADYWKWGKDSQQPHSGSRERQAEDSYPRGVAIPSKPEEFGEGQVDWAKVRREAEGDGR